MKFFETVFDIAYLIGVVWIGVLMVRRAPLSRHKKEFTLFGYMAVLLGIGDAFHLVPRIISHWSASGFEAHTVALGTGQFVTSITMTIFYLILYYIWRIRYKIEDQKGLTIVMIVLAAIRIVLCFMPQNMWTAANPPLAWGIYRNIPFALMGFIIIYLFYTQTKKTNDTAFKYMALAITLSFAFYFPVVLWAKIIPPIGALMMPKTLAYVWIVWMGYSDMQKDISEIN